MVKQYPKEFITFMSLQYFCKTLHIWTWYNNYTCVEHYNILHACTLPTILARLTIEPFATFSVTISLATACVTRNVPWNKMKYYKMIFSVYVFWKRFKYGWFDKGISSIIKNWIMLLKSFHSLSSNNIKQLLDEVFVISRIIKVEVRVISRSCRLRLITLTESLDPRRKT